MPKFFLLLVCLIGIACSRPVKKSSEAAADTVSGTELARVAPETDSSRVILFFGNSLTYGYGLDDISKAFPALIQQRIDSLGLDYNVVNAGLSGETTASGKNRIDWLLKQSVEIFVLELGANDGLRGIPVSETRKNLQEIITTVRSRKPNIQIVICGMEVPPNMGPEYQQEFRVIFKELAIGNNTALVPFLLDGVAGEPELNLPDGIHPTPEGHRILADNVWKVLKGLLEGAV